MSVQKFRINKNEGNFTTFSNTVLQNLRNLEALGLYCYLSSLPHGWEFHKNHLRKHTGIGINKLNNLLCILEQHALVKCVQIRNQKGRFAHFDLEVNDGSSFVFKDLEKEQKESVQPYHGKPLTDNRDTVNSTYKENIEKINNNKENIFNSYSATDVAQARANDDAFENYWKINPIKKNRVRAKKIWDKKKLYKIETLICADILNRLEHDLQWKDKQYIPHPSTYLLNELWNDEITEPTNPKKSSSKSSSFDAYQAELQKQNRRTTYEHGPISEK